MQFRSVTDGMGCRSALSLLLAASLILSMTGCSSGSSSGETAEESAAEDALTRSIVAIPGYNSAFSLREDADDGTSGEEETAEETVFSAENVRKAVENGEVTGGTYAETGRPAVALTFDDGPRAGTTDQILDVLEEYQAHATFFIVGENVSQDPDALKREVALGCELGTHTWSHKDLTTLSNKKFKKQLSKSIAAIEEASGGTVTCIRPPYGSINDEVKEKLELPIVLWSLDTLDWKTLDPASSLEEVQDNVKGGDIILLHDIHPETADAVENIVPWLIDQGYELLTVSELYDYYGEELTLHKGHGSAQ